MMYLLKLLNRLFYLLLLSLLVMSCVQKQLTPQDDDIRAAESYQRQAELAVADENFLDAIKLLRVGILLIEKIEISSMTIDDTEIKLNIANLEEKKGNSRVAAGLMLSVLSSRLALARSLFREFR